MGSNGKKTLVIRNGTLIDGTGSSPSENDAVVIEGNRIRSVGAIPPDLHLEDRDNVEVIDATGQWVLPGLIDGHVHLSFGRPVFPDAPISRGTTSAEFSVLRAAMNAQKALRAGFTSVSCPGGPWFIDVAVREAIDGGLVEGPRVFCAGRLISTYAGAGDREPSWMGSPDHVSGILCNGVEAMATEVRRQAKHGVNFIKLLDSDWGEWQAIAPEELSAVVDEAHRRNVRVAIHSRGSGSTRAAASAGVDWMFHGDLATEEDLDAVAEAGVRIMPTFTSVFVALERTHGYGLFPNEDEILKRSVDGGVKVAQRARELGIPLLAGTDTGNSFALTYGDLHAKEAEIFVRDVGFSPMDAIVANTSGNAFSVGLEGQVGSIEAGKLADVILIKSDPLVDIRVLQDRSNLSTVIKDGRVIDLEGPQLEANQLSFL